MPIATLACGNTGMDGEGRAQGVPQTRKNGHHVCTPPPVNLYTGKSRRSQRPHKRSIQTSCGLPWGCSVDRKCKTCGVPLPAPVGRGRPKEWCSPTCYQSELQRRSNLNAPSKDCRNCGAEMKTRQGPGRSREWCSPKCYSTELERRKESGAVDRSCRACGCDISDRRGNARFCSTQCRDVDTYSRWSSRRVQSGRTCHRCKVDISHRRGNARYCSRDCYWADRGIKLYREGPPPERKCAVCSKPFRPKSDRAKYCSVQCKGRRPKPPRKRRYTDADRARDRRKAAIRRGADTGRPVVRCEIGDRDGWRCELCRKPVDRWLEYPNPLSPSLDHIVPLSLGGIHDPANVRVTHLKCNVRRSNRIDGEQLPLAGLLEVL